MGQGAVTERRAKPLSIVIREQFETFSRSQKDVGRYIVEHMDDVAFQTAEELARGASTSSSTVVRFSQALGYEGYPELQRAVRAEYRERSVEAELRPPEIAAGPNGLASAFSADIANVMETARMLDPHEIDAACSMVRDARQIVVCGTDQLAFFASYLKHLLGRQGRSSHLVVSATHETLRLLARMREGVLFVGLSAGRPNPLVSRGMKLAASRGAKTLAICDSVLSEVSETADLSLHYSSSSPAGLRSHTALLALIQAWSHALETLSAPGTVKGHEKFRTGGHENSGAVAMKTPERWP